jgi:hypothetical protein
MPQQGQMAPCGAEDATRIADRFCAGARTEIRRKDVHVTQALLSARGEAL